MIIEFSLPLLSPLGSIPQQSPQLSIWEAPFRIMVLVAVLLLSTIVPGLAGYCVGRASKVPGASTKGAGIGVAIGILTWIFCALLLMLMGSFLAHQGEIAIILVIGLLSVALGMISTWFVIRKNYPTKTGA